MSSVVQKLTLDTDNGRPNSSTNIVVDSSGRKILFYEKFFTSGRTSVNTRITFTAPFQVNVAAGTGTINGISFSWLVATLSASPNSFEMVYVTTAGVVGITSTFSMTTIKDVAVLAYVFTGNSSITSVEEVEMVGKYVYTRRQVLSGPDWIWDDNEYVLNTGEQPRAFYVASTNKVYLSYKKDSASFLRVFDVADALTWQYIPNITIQTGPIVNLKHDPQSSINFNSAGGYEATVSTINTDLFTIGATGLSFQKVIGVYEPFIFLPFVGGSYLANMRLPYWVEIFSFNGTNYVLEDSIAFNDNSQYLVDLRWHQWTGTLGLKYIGLRIKNTLFSSDFVTEPANYVQLLVFDPFEIHSLTAVTWTSECIEARIIPTSSAGYEATIDKTSEFDINRDFETDTLSFVSAGGYEATVDKTSEFEINRDFETDTLAFQSAGGYEATIIIT